MTNQTNEFSVLITDDDTSNRNYLAGLLQALLKDATIEEAEDGETAVILTLEKIKNTGKSYDLIFMDYKMPGLNGQETTTAIRNMEDKASLEKKSVIITWSSAKNSPYSGADDWMPKPAGLAELKEALLTHGFMVLDY